MRYEKPIVFPTNAKERKRYLADSHNLHHRQLTHARTLSGWAFIAASIFFLATNFTLFSPTTLSQAASYLQLSMAEPDSSLLDTITYPSGLSVGEVQFNGGLALIDSDTLYVAQTGGVVQQTTQLSYADPVIRTNGNRVLTFDRGGVGLSLSTAISTPVHMTLEDTIQDAFIGQSNDFAVITGATGYRSAVTVYSDSGAQRFRWSTPDYYVQFAALSPSGNRMCALSFFQDGVELQSRLVFFDLDREEIRSLVDLGSVVGVSLRYIDETTVLVISDNGVFCADCDTGEVVTLASYAAEELIAFAVYEEYTLLATRAWTGHARCAVSLYDRSGLLAQTESTEEPTGLCLDDREAVLLTASGLRVFDHALTPQWENATAGGANRVLLTDTGSVWALFTKYARRIDQTDASTVLLEGLK